MASRAGGRNHDRGGGQKQRDEHRGSAAKPRLREYAQETLQILAAGRYRLADGTVVELGDAAERAKSDSKHISFSEPVAAFAAAKPCRFEGTSVTVVNSNTLPARRPCGNHVAALNFASGKNPGGGFLGGARAQEEALARSSGLYPCLAQFAQDRDKYYKLNRRAENRGIYTSCAIWSPNVPVFRAEGGELLPEPYLCSFITIPAPNAGVYANPRGDAETRQDIDLAMRDRIDRVFALAVLHDVDHLILGAFGCGVFRNNAARTAGVFQELLRTKYAGKLERVTFAILARDESRDVNLLAFRQVFQQAHFEAVDHAVKAAEGGECLTVPGGAHMELEG